MVDLAGQYRLIGDIAHQPLGASPMALTLQFFVEFRLNGIDFAHGN